MDIREIKKLRPSSYFQHLSPTNRNIMEAVLDHVDFKNSKIAYCWVSYQTICDDTGYHYNTIRRAFKQFRSEIWIQEENEEYLSNRYRMDIDKYWNWDCEEGVTKVDTRGDHSDNRGDHDDPESLKNTKESLPTIDIVDLSSAEAHKPITKIPIVKSKPDYLVQNKYIPPVPVNESYVYYDTTSKSIQSISQDQVKSKGRIC